MAQAHFAERSSLRASMAKSSACGVRIITRASSPRGTRPFWRCLNNDIIGNSVGGDGASEPSVIRVFSEALPGGTDIERVNLVGSENDSPSRELSRFIAEVVPVYVPGSYRSSDLPIRSLPAGRRPAVVSSRRLSAAVRFVEAHENFTHQHQDVRVENGVQYGDLPQYIDAHI